MEQVENAPVVSQDAPIVSDSPSTEGMDEHVVSSDGEGRELFSSESSTYSPSDLSNLDLDEIKNLKQKFLEEGDDYEPNQEDSQESDEGGLQESESLEHTQEQVEEIADSPTQPNPTDEVERVQQQQLVEAADRRIIGVEEQYNQTVATINHLQAKAEELGSDNPMEVARITYQLEGLHSEIERLKSDHAALTNYKQNMQIVPKYIPMKYFFTNEIVESFMEDGWTRDRAVNYVNNMFATESPTTIIALAKNAIHRVHTKQLLAQHNASGQRVPQTNKRNVRRDADDVAEMINRSRNIPKTLSPAAKSSVNVKAEYSMNDLAELPLEEIKRLKREELRRDGKV
jgi:FtsZ-binding cell division protein ZapB